MAGWPRRLACSPLPPRNKPPPCGWMAFRCVAPSACPRISKFPAKKRAFALIPSHLCQTENVGCIASLPRGRQRRAFRWRFGIEAPSGASWLKRPKQWRLQCRMATQSKPCWQSQSDTRLWPDMRISRRGTLKTTPRTDVAAMPHMVGNHRPDRAYRARCSKITEFQQRGYSPHNHVRAWSTNAAPKCRTLA